MSWKFQFNPERKPISLVWTYPSSRSLFLFLYLYEMWIKQNNLNLYTKIYALRHDRTGGWRPSPVKVNNVSSVRSCSVIDGFWDVVSFYIDYWMIDDVICAFPCVRFHVTTWARPCRGNRTSIWSGSVLYFTVWWNDTLMNVLWKKTHHVKLSWIILRIHNVLAV